MIRTGLFFGTYNPIHTGHLIIANYFVESTDLDEIWLVVSPQNPFKERHNLLNEFDRLHLARIATEDNEHIKVSDVEFNLPKPSYTIDTLTHLYDQYKNREFALIMGGDNLMNFHKWKKSDVILNHHHIYIYARPGSEDLPLKDHPHVHIHDDVPMLNISASYIRKCRKGGKSIKYLVPDVVSDYIVEMHLFEK